jgi:hypothetical protein
MRPTAESISGTSTQWKKVSGTARRAASAAAAVRAGSEGSDRSLAPSTPPGGERRATSTGTEAPRTTRVAVAPAPATMSPARTRSAWRRIPPCGEPMSTPTA